MAETVSVWDAVAVAVVGVVVEEFVVIVVVVVVAVGAVVAVGVVDWFVFDKQRCGSWRRGGALAAGP